MDNFIKKINKYFKHFIIIKVFLAIITILSIFLIIVNIFAIGDIFFLWANNLRYTNFFILVGILIISSYFLIKKEIFHFNIKHFLSLVELQLNESKNLLKNTYFLLLEYVNYKNYTQLLEKEALNKIKNFKLSSLFNKSHIINIIILFLISISITIIGILLQKNYITNIKRILIPWDNTLIPIDISIKVFPGDTTIVKNDSLLFKVLITSDKENQIFLDYKFNNSSMINSIQLHPENDNIYTYKMKKVIKPLSYRIRTRFYSTKYFSVNLLEQPKIKNIRFEIIPPVYTKLQRQIYENLQGDLLVYKGTKIKFLITPSKEIKNGYIIFNDSSKKTLQIDKSNILYGTVLANKNSSFYFKIIDNNDLTNINPIQYFITLKQDQYPTAKILIPGKDILIGDEKRIPIQFFCSDDFGFSKINLIYWVNESKEKQKIQLKIKDLNKKEIIGAFIWDISNLSLFTEDVVYYYIEVFDNDVISGPKQGKSQVFTIKYPSVFEIVREAENMQNEQIEDMEGTYKKYKEIMETYQNLERELKKNSEITWQKQKEILNKLEKLQGENQTIEKQIEKFSESLKKLEKFQALTKETLDKLKEVEKLMKELKPETINKLMEKMKQLIKNQNKEDLLKNLEDLKKNNKDFMDKLERTMALLKKLKAEEKISSVQKKLEEIKKEQKNIQKSLQNPNNSNPNELAKKQEKQSQFLKEVNKDIKDIKELLKEAKSQLYPKSEQISQQFNQMQMQQQSSQIKNSISKKDFQKASKMSKNLTKNLDQIQKQLNQLQKEMEQNELFTIMEKMKQMYNNLIYTSEEQEQITNKLNQIFPKDAEMNNIARKQQEIYNTTKDIADSLFEYSKKRPEITYSALQHLGNALMKMEKAIENIEYAKTTNPGRNYYQDFNNSKISSNESLKNLNKATYQIFMDLQALNQSMKSCSNPTPMPLASMQQLIGMQQQLNKSLQEIMSQMNQNGKIPSQFQERLKQLAMQQEEIAKQLQQYLEEQKRKGKKTLGRLGKTVEDMKQSSRDMENQKLDDQLIQRNNKILSRLLDSEKSMRERKLSRKRKAETAQDILAKNPDELTNDILFDNNIRKLLILNALKQQYPEKYDILIKKYFNSLLNYYEKEGTEK